MTDYTTTDIITDQTHEHFAIASSADGKYTWHHGSAGYVTEASTGKTIYLQYADRPDSADYGLVSDDTLAEMRSFVAAVNRLKSDRRETREAVAFDVELALSRASRAVPNPIETCTLYTRDQGCPLHGELCAPEYR